jgi:hypothetical protein
MINTKNMVIVGTFFSVALVLVELVRTLISLVIGYGVWIGVVLILTAVILRGMFALAMGHSDYDGKSHFLATVVCGLVVAIAACFFWLAFTA